MRPPEHHAESIGAPLRRLSESLPLRRLSGGISLLLHWDSLEPWQQDNEHILRHYRPISGCRWKSIRSLGYLHNQTVNIYSHLLGALGFFTLAFTFDYQIGSKYGLEDRILLGLFLMGATICFGSSAYFHLLGNHSSEVYNVWLTMDFFGIICLIVGTAFPLAYYTYPCHKTFLGLCWASVSVALHARLECRNQC